MDLRGQRRVGGGGVLVAVFGFFVIVCSLDADVGITTCPRAAACHWDDRKEGKWRW